MLEDYSNEQQISFKTIKNQFTKNNISHAYIIETDGYYKGFDFVLAFVKSLLCPKNNMSRSNCGNCTQCSRIDNNNYTELEIIEPDGMWIKKEQLDNLQKKFSSKSIEGSKKVYIINYADRLNEASANSILKFLEEPEPGIIAVLVVENHFNLLDTIVSRCQIIKLINNKRVTTDETENICYYLFNNQTDIANFLKLNKEETIINNAINFIKMYEQEKLGMILKENKYCGVILKDKYLFDIYLNIMVLFYKDVLNYMLFEKTDVFVNTLDAIKLVAANNTQNIVSEKIKVIFTIKDRIKNNCNLNLLLDKLIIMLEGDLNDRYSRNNI